MEGINKKAQKIILNLNEKIHKKVNHLQDNRK